MKSNKRPMLVLFSVFLFLDIVTESRIVLCHSKGRSSSSNSHKGAGRLDCSRSRSKVVKVRTCDGWNRDMKGQRITSRDSWTLNQCCPRMRTYWIMPGETILSSQPGKIQSFRAIGIYPGWGGDSPPLPSSTPLVVNHPEQGPPR
ncbi:hypothetical protein BDV38DRAFT_250985 [Aspergillus pseudotamarii]|uniref:Secreted protein n=1 Tax=Aspergillus pseudotamarii TaxID=132259 RepID=A0A5N6SPK8_ASPPS|nr:uncharacterized protein BDV38DRAFT_250985 [Aspergillus pseudotamarii]KAE8135837.1 hypothetical protein BDV38DRAFT_250985 [Aspergillus pseudotamarii]